MSHIPATFPPLVLSHIGGVSTYPAHLGMSTLYATAGPSALLPQNVLMKDLNLGSMLPLHNQMVALGNTVQSVTADIAVRMPKLDFFEPMRFASISLKAPIANLTFATVERDIDWTATVRMPCQTYPVLLHSSPAGISLTAMNCVVNRDLPADWWRPWAAAMAERRVTFEDGFEHRFDTAQSVQLPEFADGELVDYFENVDLGMAQYSKIVSSLVVFFPRARASESRGPGQAAFLKRAEMEPHFHSDNSPTLATRSLKARGWDRLLQVRA